MTTNSLFTENKTLQHQGGYGLRSRENHSLTRLLALEKEPINKKRYGTGERKKIRKRRRRKKIRKTNNIATLYQERPREKSKTTSKHRFDNVDQNIISINDTVCATPAPSHQYSVHNSDTMSSTLNTNDNTLKQQNINTSIYALLNDKDIDDNIFEYGYIHAYDQEQQLRHMIQKSGGQFKISPPPPSSLSQNEITNNTINVNNDGSDDDKVTYALPYEMDKNGMPMSLKTPLNHNVSKQGGIQILFQTNALDRQKNTTILQNQNSVEEYTQSHNEISFKHHMNENSTNEFKWLFSDRECILINHISLDDIRDHISVISDTIDTQQQQHTNIQSNHDEKEKSDLEENVDPITTGENHLNENNDGDLKSNRYQWIMGRYSNIRITQACCRRIQLKFKEVIWCRQLRIEYYKAISRHHKPKVKPHQIVISLERGYCIIMLFHDHHRKHCALMLKMNHYTEFEIRVFRDTKHQKTFPCCQECCVTKYHAHIWDTSFDVSNRRYRVHKDGCFNYAYYDHKYHQHYCHMEDGTPSLDVVWENRFSIA